MKVFALTSRRQSRGNWVNRRTTIAYAAQRRFFARRNFGGNCSQRDRDVFFLAHAREIRAQISKTAANCLSRLQLSSAQNCARMRTSAHGCAQVRTFARRPVCNPRTRRPHVGRENLRQQRGLHHGRGIETAPINGQPRRGNARVQSLEGNKRGILSTCEARKSRMAPCLPRSSSASGCRGLSEVVA